MNTQELERLQQDTKEMILHTLHRDTFGNTNPEGSWDIIRKFYDIAILHSLYFSDSNLMDPYSFGDSLDALESELIEAMEQFYNDNPELLNEKFTLNNNFYPVDLRSFITDNEGFILSNKRDNDND